MTRVFNVNLIKEFSDLLEVKGEPVSDEIEGFVQTITKNLPPRILRVKFNTAGIRTISATVPQGKMWRFIRYYFKVIATAGVGNRLIGYIITNENNAQLTRLHQTTAQTASQTKQHHGSRDFDVAAGGDSQRLTVSEMFLREGDTFTFEDKSLVDASDTADGLMEFEEWDT